MAYLDIIIIISYFLITILVGLYSGRNVSNIRDFAVGNKGFSTLVIMMTITATWLDAEAVLVTTTEIYKATLIYTLICASVVISQLLIGYVFAPRMEKILHFMTIGEIIGDMYGKWSRVITGFAGGMLSVGYVASQVKAISIIFTYFFGMDTVFGTIISSLIIVIYSSFGGIKSVTFTDVVQFATLVITIPLICNIGLSEVGGFSELMRQIPSEKLTIFPTDGTFAKYFFYVIILAIPLFSPPIMQRMLLAKNIKQIQDSFLLSAIFNIPFFATVCVIGLTAYVLFPDVADPNEVFLIFTNNLMPVGLKGLAVAGLLAVIMSSADSFMNTAGLSFSHDMLKPIYGDRLSDKHELFATKLITLLVGIGAIYLSFKYDTILELLLLTFNFWGPVVTMPLVFGVFGVKASSKSFYGAAISGSLMVFIWRSYIADIAGDVDSLLPSLFASSLGFWVIKIIEDAKIKNVTVKN